MRVSLTPIALKMLFTLYRKQNEVPYFDAMQAKSGLSIDDTKAAFKELFDFGLVMHCAAPKGVLYYLTEASSDTELICQNCNNSIYITGDHDCGNGLGATTQHTGIFPSNLRHRKITLFD